MAAMDMETTIWTKEERIDDMPNSPGSMFPEDLLNIGEPSLHVKKDPGLELHMGGRDCHLDFVEGPLGLSCSTDFTKEDPELNLEADGTENIVATSTRYESNSRRLIQNNSESCGISFEETVNQEVVYNELEVCAEKSPDFTMVGPHTHGLTSIKDSLFSVILKCSLRKKDFDTFCCSFCLQSFPSKYKLIMHVFIHIDGVQPPTYVCKSCGEVFPSHVTLNKHLKMSENDKALSPDNNKKFDSSDDYRNNFFEGDKEMSVTKQTEKQSSSKETCKISKKSFNDICGRHTTSITHSAEEQDRYDDYGTTSAMGNVVDHTALLTTKTQPKYGVCGKSFTQSGHLKRHSLVHTGTRPHKCDICGNSFNRLHNLKRHALTHTGPRPHKCDICDKSFTLVCDLKRHSLIHTEKRPHACGVYGKSFAHSCDLKRHTFIHTGMRPHKCDICGKSFTELGHVKKHTLIHTGTRRHKCDICGNSFTALHDLKRHAMIHTGKRPHICVTCGKSFSVAGNPKKHILIHTGLRPHKCHVCDKLFTHLHNLRTHALIHKGIRPQKCYVCGKSFTELSTLKKHLLIHTGIRPHKCDICGKSFTQWGHLKRHSLLHTDYEPHTCNT